MNPSEGFTIAALQMNFTQPPGPRLAAYLRRELGEGGEEEERDEKFKRLEEAPVETQRLFFLDAFHEAVVDWFEEQVREHGSCP